MADEDKLRDYLRRAIAEAHESRTRLGELTRRAREPIAIVGAGCRLPGGATTPDALWDLVADGRDVVGPFPADRGWTARGVGGFLDDAASFDAGFFGISPREALAMDPQQRLLLETSWEALERAGIDPVSLRGSRTGVWVGSSGVDYARLVTDEHDVYGGTGYHASVLSGRLSYVYGLTGPTVTLDTGCSSFLVGVHTAAQSLRSGETSLALVGAATIMATPAPFGVFERQDGLAADGRCKAFADAADGTGWAEGAGVVVLERLSDAQRNGHPVLAVIVGSAVNSDGASNGLSAPNGQSQQQVIRAALASAGLSPADVDLVEAHGTGTTLGDPIEARALLATYGRDRDIPLYLGSVKSNMGHAQGAAGLVGLLKAALAVQAGELPPTLHVDRPSSHVDWTDGRIELVSTRQPWPAVDRPRRAGVSAFSISGANAHVILEQAPPADEHEPADDPAIVPWLLSARTAAAVRAQAAALLASPAAATPLDTAYSLVTTRTAFDHRAVVVGRDAGELSTGLRALADGLPNRSVVTGYAPPDRDRKVAFVFPGQGSQWAGMGAALLDHEPVFAESVVECASALRPHVDWSLADVLRTGDGLDRVDIAQPALWAVMVSLARVWQAHGVRPSAVVGHSQGEIAAAVIAGVLSVQDGARVVALRSKAIAAHLSGKGAMASISATDVRVPPGVSVAAVNGPGSVVVSGEPDAVADLVAAYTADGVRAKLIPVDYASHSAHVEGIRDVLARDLVGVAPKPGSIPFLSSVTGEQTHELDGDYWYENLRRTVELERSVRTLVADGFDAFVEVSPHPVLTMALRETVDEDVVVVGTIRRDDGGRDRLLTSFAEAHVGGVRIDWPGLLDGGRRVPLPTYAFQRERYWLPPVGQARQPVYTVEWRPFTVGEHTADVEVLHWNGSVADALAMVRAHVTSDRPHLAVVTTHAVATHPAEHIASTVDAAVRGLLRSAQSEHPGRLTLVDVDTPETDVRPVVAAAIQAQEPQVAIRNGRAMVARLAIAPPTTAPAWTWDGTVLVTGGTGTVGAAVARHLVAQHDVRSLVLVSRRGQDAPGALELRAELAAAGATVHLAACDVTDRAAVERLLAEVPPVRGVVHAAAALADGVLTNLTAEQTEHVIAAKLDSATHLRDLTHDLTAFVVFSSWAGLSGAAGQANYAAANAGVDALAHNLRADGVPAVSLAWGFWTDRSGLTGALSDADIARLGRSGVTGVDVSGSLALLDAAAYTDRAVVAPVRLDPAVDDVPALLWELIQPRATDKAKPADLKQLVAAHTAAVLGHTDPSAVEENRGFLDQGMTSLTAVDLRNRLSADTGLRLPVTMIFDYPTPRALVAYLRTQLDDDGGDDDDPLAEVEAAIARLDPHDRSQLIQRLTAAELGARDDDEMFALIDKELGLA